LVDFGLHVKVVRVKHTVSSVQRASDVVAALRDPLERGPANWADVHDNHASQVTSRAVLPTLHDALVNG